MAAKNRASKGALTLVVFAFCGVITTSRALLAQAPTGDKLWNRLIQDAYAKHDQNLRKTLPQYSGLPPVLDLTGRQLQDGVCDIEQQHSKWEARFNGIMGDEPITDPGIPRPLEATSIVLTTIDGENAPYALPAKQSSLIVVARPIKNTVCISQRRNYVYTRFHLDISRKFKHPRHDSTQDGQVTSVQFGGSIRLPSGQLATYLLDQRGFIGLNKQYVLFLWRPIQSDEMYVVTQAYLIENGMVFPVSASAPNAFHYTKMPLDKFEAKVKAAVKKNIDTD